MKKFIFLLVLTSWLPLAALADGALMPPQGHYARETGQRALIFFENNQETIVVSSTFQTDAEHFAWIIPTPTEPEVKRASSEIFNSLDKFTQLYSDNPYMVESGLDLRGYDYTTAPAVTVLKDLDIAYYDITVLAANDASALNKWLNDHGYNFPSSNNYILEDYVKNNWYFTAVKISGQYLSGNIKSALKSGDLIPLSLTFSTDKLVFPLKISSADLYDETNGLNFYFERYRSAHSFLLAKNTQDSYFSRQYTEDAYVLERLLMVISSTLQSDLNGRVPYENSVASKLNYITAEEYQKAVDELANAKITAEQNNTLPNAYNTLNTAFTELYQDLQKIGSLKNADNNSYNYGSNNPYVTLNLYIIADKFFDYSNFETRYLGTISQDQIKDLALNDQGKPWFEPTQEKYALTKLYRYMQKTDMTSDLYFQESKIQLNQVGERSKTAVYILIGVAVLVSLLVAGATIVLNKKDNI